MRGPVRSFVLLLITTVFAACGQTTAPCSPATCGGCCDADGQCVDGSADLACGNAGLNCNVCSGGQSCVSKRCEFGQMTVDAGTEVDAGMPIIAPVETWTWADFPNSACGNGVATGIGVSISTRSKDVLIYLMGGGACWNALTCQFAATNIAEGYTSASFAADTTTRAPPFNRTNTNNPFKDMSYVFVPYCTGDVHAGDAVQNYPSPTPQIPARTVHHKGGKNMEAFLLRLKDTFPDAERVFVSGSSAGAFGAQLNYERVAATWPNAQVHVFADCGQMINPQGNLLTEWVTNWGMQIPADCTGCASDFAKFPAYLHGKYPNRRFGLLAYTQDGTLRQFFGLDATTFQTRTLQLATDAYDPRTNAKYFILAGSNHVMLGDYFTITAPGGPTLLDWSKRFVSGDAAWANVKP
jgi:hypothetical protein